MRYCLAFFLIACGPEDGLIEARPPELGKADSGDAPDNACKVVLREMRGLDDVTVDVDDRQLDAGARPGLIYSFDLRTWFEAPAPQAVNGGLAGYDRFRFRIVTPPGSSDQVELIPYLRVAGGRLFDHNRNPGSLDNYVARRDAGFVVPPDDDACPARGLCDTPGAAFQRVFPGVKVSYPVAIRQAPGDRSRFYVVEKGGLVKAFANSSATTETQTFLDLEALTYRTARGEIGWEEGLLDLAFHPQWPARPEAYVTYVNGRGADMFWRLSRVESRDGGRTLAGQTEQVLIQEKKPEDTHNGGSLAFGPDGFLYVSIGDGGGVLDRNNNAQNTNTLFGSILRLDVNERGARGYTIPADNPFASGQGGRPELFAWGIRNPWRMSFDRQTGELFEAEVGQDDREELNLIQKGKNYGYPIKEARRCTGKVVQLPGGARLDCSASFEDPLFETYHPGKVPAGEAGAAEGKSITGGYVYRGRAIPALVGWYVFGDFELRSLWAWRRGLRHPIKLGDTGQLIASFGEDVDGELYFVHHAAVGRLYKLVDGPCQTPPPRDGRFYAFLSRDGVGSEAQAIDYYQSNLPGRDLGSYTLDDWRAENLGDRPTVQGYYRNAMDLGFWREMSCTREIGRGFGGCMVRNWAEEGDVSDPSKDDLGTVTMNISPEGYTRFYVFGPDDLLSPFAILDDEQGNGVDDADKKFVPAVCTACHGGTWAPGGDPDLGALWREFEPSLLEKRSGITQADAEREWAELNQAILGANRALRSEEEGAPNDFNRWRTALTDYVEGGLSAALPESWRGGATAEVAAAKAAMWTDVVHPYCMGCHRINTKGFDEYESFEGLAAVFQGDQALIDAYTKGDPRNLANRALAFMPQAFLQWQRLNADAVAQGAMADWVQQVSNPAGPTCRVTFRTNGPDWTAPGQDVWITGNSEELGGWNPLGGLELGAPSWPTWQGSIDLPQGQTIEYKATVVTSWNGNVVWEAGANHIVTIPTGTACQATFTTDWRDP